MGDAYFIPLEPERFFEAHDLGPTFSSPPGGSDRLRFEPRCLGCGKSTASTLVLRGGLRGSATMTWEQPVPMCESCKVAAERRRRLSTTTSFGALGVACGVTGAVVLWLFVALAVSKVVLMIVFIVVAVATWLLTRAAAAAWLEPRLSRGESGEVELFYFRDPRLGPDARFLCLRIERQEQAEAFAAINPHAIPSEVWDSLFALPGRRQETPT